MCGLEDIPKIASVVLALVTAACSGVYAFKFKGRLRAKHGSAWRELGSAGRVPEDFHFDADPQDLFIPRYLFSGAYKALRDPALSRLASTTKFFFVLFILFVLLLPVSELMFPSVPGSSCVQVKQGPK